MKTLQANRVAVLMSTYNGEAFLNEQIDTIMSQKDVSVELFIRDDGSSDRTVEIVQSYIDKGKPIHLVNGDENYGPGLSFLTLLYYMRDEGYIFDYYAFADQDDYWLDEKLREAITKISMKTTKGVLYCSNQIIYQNGAIKGNRHNTIPDLTLKGHLCKNSLSGCTFVFDFAMFEIITDAAFPKEDIILKRCHDSWVILVALICGVVIYDQNAYILYRIHDNNVVGIKHINAVSRAKRALSPKKSLKRIRSRTAQELLDCVHDLDIETKDVLEEFAWYDSSMTNKMRLIRDKEILKITGENSIAFAIKVLLNYV